MLDQTLRHYWHPIAKLDQVTAEPQQFWLLGENLVMYRDDEGIVALRDKCIHRGVALSTGCIQDGRLMCPYHGWQYDRSGQVAFIPSIGEDGAIPSQARVDRYRVQDGYGLVWVALDEPLVGLPPWPDDDWNNPDWHTFLVDTWAWKSSAGRMIENAADFSHFNFVHKGFTELADGPFIKPFDIVPTDDGVLSRTYTIHMPFTIHDRKSVVAESGGQTWSEKGESKAGDVTTISFVASPTDDAETLIFVFLSRNHSLDSADADFATGFDEVMEQDRVIVETQDPATLPLDPRDELHLKLPDSASIAHRRLLRGLEPSGA